MSTPALCSCTTTRGSSGSSSEGYANTPAAGSPTNEIRERARRHKSSPEETRWRITEFPERARADPIAIDAAGSEAGPRRGPSRIGRPPTGRKYRESGPVSNASWVIDNPSRPGRSARRTPGLIDPQPRPDRRRAGETTRW
jgi:hypothetical protein